MSSSIPCWPFVLVATISIGFLAGALENKIPDLKGLSVLKQNLQLEDSICFQWKEKKKLHSSYDLLLVLFVFV